MTCSDGHGHIGVAAVGVALPQSGRRCVDMHCSLKGIRARCVRELNQNGQWAGQVHAGAGPIRRLRIFQ
jgi:hypothetical protein